jgi:uncharacterized protein (TIGR01777 family)
MRVVIAGGTGLIGQALSESLLADRHDVVILTRRASEAGPATPGTRLVSWRPPSTGGWESELDGAEAVVNLAGASIAGESLLSILFGHWTAASKDAILRSRVDAGEALAAAIRKASRKPSVFVQASGVNYYGVRIAGAVAEDAPAGNDFLASVAERWEASSAGVEDVGVRRAVLRTGVVLARSDGVLPMVALPFRMLVGGPLGSGQQWFPWIHIHDQVRAIRFAMENPQVSGTYNAVAPEAIRNAAFGRALARRTRRPYWFPTPALLLRLMLGEKSTLVLEGAQIVPQRLIQAEFRFSFPTAELALQDIYG